jgi:hypothetical protein
MSSAAQFKRKAAAVRMVSFSFSATAMMAEPPMMQFCFGKVTGAAHKGEGIW